MTVTQNDLVKEDFTQSLTDADPKAVDQGLRILLEALPYIREFEGRTVVIKYGGAAMKEEALRSSFARDVELLKHVGINPVIVHGGGPEVSEWMGRLGLPVEFVDGLRKTGADAIDIVRMVLVGAINKDIVQRMNWHKAAAVGFSGSDGNLFRATKVESADVDLGFVGTVSVDDVNIDLLNHVIQDYVPVIASIGVEEKREGDETDDIVYFNVNADDLAAAIAGALGAYKVIFMTDVDGFFEDPDKPETLVSFVKNGQLESLIERTEGGMLPKLISIKKALDGGADQAHIINGKIPHSLLLELFTGNGVGTHFVPE